MNDIRVLKKLSSKMYKTYVKLSSIFRIANNKEKLKPSYCKNNKYVTVQCMEEKEKNDYLIAVENILEKIYNTEEYSDSGQLQFVGLIDKIIY